MRTGLPDDTLTLHLQYTAPLTDATRNGCDVKLPKIYNQETWLNWIKVISKNGDGEEPVYTWLKYVPETPLGAAQFTPDPTGLWGSGDPLVFHNSLYLTSTVVAPDNVYLWLVDSDGDMIAQSPALSDDAELLIEIEDNMDPNFSIRYTDAGSFGDMSADDWNGHFNVDEVKHASFQDYLDDKDDLNVLTAYWEDGNFAILVPKTDDYPTQTLLESAEVYYNGDRVLLKAVNPVLDYGIPANDPDAITEYFTVRLDETDIADYVSDPETTKEEWSFNNSKVVILFEDDVNNKIHIAGAADGAGPRLLSAYVKYDAGDQLTLKFSEDLDEDEIIKATKDDINIMDVDIHIRSLAINPDDASELIIKTNTDVPEGTDVNITDEIATTIMDVNGNPAYQVIPNVEVSVERKIEEVSVVAISRDAETTTIQIVFDKSMEPDVAATEVEDANSYVIEYVPGLEEDEDNPGAALLSSTNIDYDDATLTATITLDGVIESTAAEDLPQVSIVQDIFGGNPEAPLREEDKVAHTPEDKIGPYLKSAAFSYNAEMGDSIADCIEQEKATLTLGFSEEVIAPRIMDDRTFVALEWNVSSLHRRSNSAGEQVEYGVWEVVLTLDQDEAAGVDLPYGATSEFNNDPNMYIDDAGDIEDAEENEASDPLFRVPITDATDLWVVEAKTGDTTGLEGVVDLITVTFGKDIYIKTNKFEREDKVVSINGDPNIVDEVDMAAADNVIEISLLEEIDGVDRQQNTAWTPEVSFDLDEDDGIIIEDDTEGEVDFVDDFSLTSSDGVAPILTNIVGVADNEIEAFTKTKPDPGSSDPFTYMVKLKFSEPMDPNIWEEPDYARYYFDDIDVNVTITTFLTPDSDPPGTSSLTCGGSVVAVLLETEEEVGGGVDMQIKLRGASGGTTEGEFTDMSGNPFDPAATLTLAKGELEDPWTIPGDHTKSIVPTMKAMRIYGTIVEDPNDAEVSSGEVYAFYRDELFLIEENDMDDPNKGVFNIDPNRAFGGTTIQEGGTYFIKAYGKESVSGTAQKGFEFGDAVILVVCQNPTDAVADRVYDIATTACLANTDYSIAFDGGPTKLPVEHNIDLGEREVITLQTGWNLISTSISSAYVNSSLCTLTGLDVDDYTGYIYGPDDPLAGEGSIPAVDEMYEMDDISSVLFTLSHSYFTGNLFYDPATNPIFPVEDELADRFNKTPVFCTGRGYYIYIEDVNTPTNPDPVITDPLPHDWKIVLFGQKVPAPDYKLKVESNTDLIGQWGNLAYYTYDGDGELTNIEDELPSTYDDRVFIDDIAGIGSDIAMNVCDINGDAVDMQVVSTFWNFGGTDPLNYPASWYAGLPEFNDLKMVAPGAGYWILVDADAADGPFFVSYMPKPEED